MSNKLIVIGLIMLLIVIAGAAFVFVKNSQKPDSKPQIGSNNTTRSAEVVHSEDPIKKFEGSSENCESSTNPKFTADITDLSKVVYLTPPVTIQSGDLKTHGYIHLGENSSKVPVYSPVNAKLYEGSFYAEGGEGLYSLFFEVSCEVRFMLDHIIEPVEKISKVFPEKPAADSRTNKVGPVEFKAGELIGHTGGTPYSKNWDFGVYNLTKENPYRNKQYEHSGTFRYSNAVCPYEYFTKELRAKYDKLMTDSYGKPLNNPTNLCQL